MMTKFVNKLWVTLIEICFSLVWPAVERILTKCWELSDIATKLFIASSDEGSNDVEGANTSLQIPLSNNLVML